jgi:hypothetical protein
VAAMFSWHVQRPRWSFGQNWLLDRKGSSVLLHEWVSDLDAWRWQCLKRFVLGGHGGCSGSLGHSGAPSGSMAPLKNGLDMILG